MTKLTLIILILIANLMNGQTCKVTKDPFSNSEVISYKFGKYINFELKEKQILLKYYFRFEGELNTTMAKNSFISFKFKNGEIVELPITEEVFPVTQIDPKATFSSRVWTEYTVSMVVSLEQLKIFSESSMTHVKYPDMKGGFITSERSKRWVENFTDGANCIMSNMSKQ